MSFFQQEDLAYKKGRTKPVKQQQQTNPNVLPRNTWNIWSESKDTYLLFPFSQALQT